MDLGLRVDPVNCVMRHSGSGENKGPNQLNTANEEPSINARPAAFETHGELMNCIYQSHQDFLDLNISRFLWKMCNVIFMIIKLQY